MLIWKILVDAAKTAGIDHKKRNARNWIHKHLPELLITPLDEQGRHYEKNGRIVREEHFNWKMEWPKWQQCFEALLWLAQRREKPPETRSVDDRIPLRFQKVIDATIARTRNVILSDYLSEATIVLQFSGSFITHGHFRSLDELWEAVFCSYFRPDLIPQGSVCSNCGKPLPRTKKTNKASKATSCDQCRLKIWREENPDRTRELWRKAKQNERKQ
jgi:hypothetical protein